MLEMISIFLNLPRLGLWPRMWSILQKIPCALEKKVKFIVLGWNVLRRNLEGCSPWGRWGSDTTERLHFHFSLWHIGEGNGNPLQCSCLENPRDREAWWAAIYGVTQSWTRLMQLSSRDILPLGWIFQTGSVPRPCQVWSPPPDRPCQQIFIVLPLHTK